MSGAPEAADRPAPTRNRPILGYIKDKDGVLPRTLVTEDGRIYRDASIKLRWPAKTALRTLRRLVAEELRLEGEPEIAAVDPVTFKRLTAPPDAPAAAVAAGPAIASEAAAIAEHIINEGIDRGASDLFLDIRDDTGHLTYKVSGRIVPAKKNATLPQDVARSVVRAMWAKGNRDWVPNGPCDVAFSMREGDRLTRIRGNSLYEATRGHAVACRMRNPKEVIPIAKAGYTRPQQQALERMSKASGGLIVIAGPTDSGKSTTLTSIVSSMDRSLRKIEIADPPEVYLDHCVHVEVERSLDGSYRHLDQVLGAVVRQNPDVLVLGEIRDEMSARAAMGMAQQGKRVFTSVHANGAAGVPSRLGDMGVDMKLLGFREFFAGCASQNLVALLCPDCSVPASEIERGKRYADEFGPHARMTGPGCTHCSGGVISQTLVAEVYPLLDDAGDAYKLIRDSDFSGLQEYMRSEHKCEDKHDVAYRIITSGRIDPADTIRRIGLFPKREYAPGAPPPPPPQEAAVPSDVEKMAEMVKLLDPGAGKRQGRGAPLPPAGHPRKPPAKSRVASTRSAGRPPAGGG